MGQKTDTLERDRTKTTDSLGSTSSDPPSWSELSQKADTNEVTKNGLVLGGAALAFSVVAPIGPMVAIFLTTIIGSAVGFGDAKSGAIAGGAVGGISGFFGSILFSIVTLGIFTVVPMIVVGALVGGIAGYVGKKLR